jgi:hypothetical protein
MSPFVLQPRTWYAMEYVFPSAQRHYSPIWAREITLLKTGSGMLRLQFFHANYPEGVQDKVYDLQIAHRFDTHLVALHREDGISLATVILEPITKLWFTQHLPNTRLADSPSVSLASQLDFLTGRIPL